MKIGGLNMLKLKIKDNTSYSKYVKWTEDKTGEIMLKKNTLLTHSSDKKVKAFSPKVTCFFKGFPYLTYNRELQYTGDYQYNDYIYIAIIKSDIIVEEFDNEVRINLDIHRNDIEIFYIGKCVRGKAIEGKVAFNLSETFINEYL